MTVLPNKLENLLVEKNVEMITWAVLENSCLEEVNNCLIAKHLFTVLLTPGLKVASETGHTWGGCLFFLEAACPACFWKSHQVHMTKTPGVAMARAGIRAET